MEKKLHTLSDLREKPTPVPLPYATFIRRVMLSEALLDTPTLIDRGREVHVS